MLVTVTLVVFVAVLVCVVVEVLVTVVVVNKAQTVSDVDVHGVEMYCETEQELHAEQKTVD